MAKAQKTQQAQQPTQQPVQAAKSVAAPTALKVVRTPTHEEISRRAYELYLARGKQPGHPQEDWNQAERELSAKLQKN